MVRITRTTHPTRLYQPDSVRKRWLCSAVLGCPAPKPPPRPHRTQYLLSVLVLMPPGVQHKLSKPSEQNRSRTRDVGHAKRLALAVRSRAGQHRPDRAATPPPPPPPAAQGAARGLSTPAPSRHCTRIGPSLHAACMSRNVHCTVPWSRKLLFACARQGLRLRMAYAFVSSELPCRWW